MFGLNLILNNNSLFFLSSLSDGISALIDAVTSIPRLIFEVLVSLIGVLLIPMQIAIVLMHDVMYGFLTSTPHPGSNETVDGDAESSFEATQVMGEPAEDDLFYGLQQVAEGEITAIAMLLIALAIIFILLINVIEGILDESLSSGSGKAKKRLLVAPFLIVLWIPIANLILFMGLGVFEAINSIQIDAGSSALADDDVSDETIDAEYIARDITPDGANLLEALLSVMIGYFIIIPTVIIYIVALILALLRLILLVFFYAIGPIAITAWATGKSSISKFGKTAIKWFVLLSLLPAVVALFNIFIPLTYVMTTAITETMVSDGIDELPIPSVFDVVAQETMGAGEEAVSVIIAGIFLLVLPITIGILPWALIFGFGKALALSGGAVGVGAIGSAKAMSKTGSVSIAGSKKMSGLSKKAANSKLAEDAKNIGASAKKSIGETGTGKATKKTGAYIKGEYGDSYVHDFNQGVKRRASSTSSYISNSRAANKTKHGIAKAGEKYNNTTLQDVEEYIGDAEFSRSLAGKSAMGSTFMSGFEDSMGYGSSYEDKKAKYKANKADDKRSASSQQGYAYDELALNEELSKEELKRYQETGEIPDDISDELKHEMAGNKAIMDVAGQKIGEDDELKKQIVQKYYGEQKGIKEFEKNPEKHMDDIDDEQLSQIMMEAMSDDSDFELDDIFDSTESQNEALQKLQSVDKKDVHRAAMKGDVDLYNQDFFDKQTWTDVKEDIFGEGIVNNAVADRNLGSILRESEDLREVIAGQDNVNFEDVQDNIEQDLQSELIDTLEHDVNTNRTYNKVLADIGLDGSEVARELENNNIDLDNTNFDENIFEDILNNTDAFSNEIEDMLTNGFKDIHEKQFGDIDVYDSLLNSIDDIRLDTDSVGSVQDQIDSQNITISGDDLQNETIENAEDIVNALVNVEGLSSDIELEAEYDLAENITGDIQNVASTTIKETVNEVKDELTDQIEQIGEQAGATREEIENAMDEVTDEFVMAATASEYRGNVVNRQQIIDAQNNFEAIANDTSINDVGAEIIQITNDPQAEQFVRRTLNNNTDMYSELQKMNKKDQKKMVQTLGAIMQTHEQLR